MNNDVDTLAAHVLEQARGGDRAAFGAIVRCHQHRVYSIALRMLGRRDAAEDLAQDVFLRLFGNLASIESAQHLEFWLRRVTSNLAIDRIRRLPLTATQPLTDALAVCATDGGTLGGSHDSSTEGIDPLRDREIRRLLEKLTPAARSVLVLRFQQDMDIADIAAALDLPANTVKSHLHRSLTTLRSQLLHLKMIPAEQAL